MWQRWYRRCWFGWSGGSRDGGDSENDAGGDNGSGVVVMAVTMVVVRMFVTS